MALGNRTSTSMLSFYSCSPLHESAPLLFLLQRFRNEFGNGRGKYEEEQEWRNSFATRTRTFILLRLQFLHPLLDFLCALRVPGIAAFVRCSPADYTQAMATRAASTKNQRAIRVFRRQISCSTLPRNGSSIQRRTPKLSRNPNPKVRVLLVL